MHTFPKSRAFLVVAVSALTVALSGGLAACSHGDAPAPDVSVSNSAIPLAKQTAEPLKPSKPTGLRIPSAGVDATTMLDLTTDANGELDVPPVNKAEEPGWWKDGPTPGERGAAVIVAHYDTAEGPALMKNIKNVKIGDLIEIGRADGSTAKFKIREIEQVNKKNFPTQKVYGKSTHPELRLLTCGGGIKGGHRTDNIILYADLVH